MAGNGYGSDTTASRLGISVMLLGMVALLFAGFGVSTAGATKPNPEHKVTLCHRTGSHSNPYVVITVDVASVLHGHGHDGHNGPVFYDGIPKHVKWGDIIPPFDYGPGEQYAGKNWTSAGIAIWSNGCNVPSSTTTTTGQSNNTSTSTSTSTSTTTTTTTGESSSSSSSTTSTTGGPNDSSTSTSTTGGPNDSSSSTSTSSTLGGLVGTTPGDGTVNDQGITSKAGPTVASQAGGSGTLPFTGSSLGLVGVGLALLASGLGLLARKRRLTTH